MGTVRRLAEEVGRALKTALPTLRKTVVDKAALAVGGGSFMPGIYRFSAMLATLKTTLRQLYN